MVQKESNIMMLGRLAPHGFCPTYLCHPVPRLRPYLDRAIHVPHLVLMACVAQGACHPIYAVIFCLIRFESTLIEWARLAEDQEN